MKETETHSRSEDSLRQTKESLAQYALKYGELNKLAKEDLGNLRTEVVSSRQELLTDFSAKVEDLGSKCVALTLENEALGKKTAQDSEDLTKALAEIESLRKKETKSKRKKKLEEKIVSLKADLKALGAEKDRSEQMSKTSYQDGFCLARHQVLARYPGLDLSHLSALDFPIEPKSSWSKVELLNLPPARPVHLTEFSGGDNVEETSDTPA